MMSKYRIVGAWMSCALLAPLPALAAHGKAGMWTATTTMTAQGMPATTRSVSFCMTPEQVQADRLPPTGNPSCNYENESFANGTFSADLVCTGEHEGRGHMTTIYDSDTHYSGEMNFTSSEGTIANKFEGHWVKADCSGAEH